MGVFDFLPGRGGDGEGASSSEDASTDGEGTGRTESIADLAPADLRERAETLSKRSDVPTLDFTVDSLDSLDDLATGSAGGIGAVAYGSYLGETIVRAYGGEWVDEGGWQVAVALPDDRTTVAVFDAAEMSIDAEPVFAGVAARLEAQGAGRTADGLDGDETTGDRAGSGDEGVEADGDEADDATDSRDASGPTAAVDEGADRGTPGGVSDTGGDGAEPTPERPATDDDPVDRETVIATADPDDGTDVPADSPAAEPADTGPTATHRDATEGGDSVTAVRNGDAVAATGDGDHVTAANEEPSVLPFDDASDAESERGSRPSVLADDASVDTVSTDTSPTDAAPADDAFAAASGVDGRRDERDESPADDFDDATGGEETFGVVDAETDAATDAETGSDSDEEAAGDTDDAGADPGAPERFVLRAAAEELADGWPERGLDFTPASLPRLDAFVADLWDGRFRASSLADRTVDHEDDGDPLVQLGAYYGEVLVRWLDGEWVATDDGEGAIEVPDVGETVERVDVFAIARECLVPPSTFAYRYDALIHRLYTDEPPVSDGRTAVFDDDRDGLTAGDVITQFADEAEAFIDAWPKYPLDYTPRSVRALDEITESLLDDVGATDAALAAETDPESLWLTARATAAGAYFAAVLVRHRDAQWRIGDDVELVVDQGGVERTVDPVATAADCLRGETGFVRTYRSLDE